jgi:hypothetical protein
MLNDAFSPGLDGSGGTFRYGHIYYRMLRENTVEFTIEAAFTREVDTSYFYGSALDGYSQLGDQITMTGRETPQFELGDEGLITKLTMDVIAYSVSENWVMGKTVIVHKYEYPNNAGNPWLARFSGCCRFSQLRNNGDKPWELFAQVDLTQASASPRVSVLPIVSVPKESKMPDEDFDGVIGPKVIVPATIPVAGEPKTCGHPCPRPPPLAPYVSHLSLLWRLLLPLRPPTAATLFCRALNKLVILVTRRTNQREGAEFVGGRK